MKTGWRKLRAAALVLRLLRSRRSVGSPVARKAPPLRVCFPFESNACCALRKELLLKRIIAKPFYSRSDVDVKLLAGMLRNCRFNAGLSSASTDALARMLHFRVVEDGEVLFRQGDAIEEASERFLVIYGSILVFSQQGGAVKGPQTNTGDVNFTKFGKCEGTCNPGSSCGEDVMTGAIVRKTTAMAQTTTWVAFVTKADYLRIARFNVDAEAKVLDDVRLLFEETPCSTAPLRLDPVILRDRQAMRVMKRFLHRYECFRMLPQEFLIRLAQKLQLHTFEPGERIYPLKDGVPKMFFILSGECCVHVSQTTEEDNLKMLTVDRKRNSGMKISTFNGTVSDNICCSETHDQAPGVIPDTHICSLVGGDSFGEIGLQSSSASLNRANVEGVALSIPPTSRGVCAAISVSIEEYFELRSQYLDLTDFTASVTFSILSSKLPRDRTSEQLGYVAAYLTRHSSAKLFFSQFPPPVLHEICLHVTLEKYATGKKLMACVQEQGKRMASFRVVLDGHLVIFKTYRRGDHTIGFSDDPYAHVAGDQPRNHVEGGSQYLPTSIEGDGTFVEPVGILCEGSAFGLLAILLDSTSPFGYVPYAAGSTMMTTNILSIPTPLAKLHLAAIDEYLVCHPKRALKHTIRTVKPSSRFQLSSPRKSQAMNDFERFILHYPIVSGIPRPKLRLMIHHMLVVNVPARYFLFEAGEVAKGCIFIILEGSVRTYRCPVTESKRDSKLPLRSKTGAKRTSKFVMEPTEDFIAEEAPSTTEHAMFTFTRPVDDDFFAREYKFVNDLGAGDGFGRHGALDNCTQPPNRNRSSNKLGLLLRRSTSHRLQTRQHSAVYSVYPETAITVSNCRLGILRGDSTEEGALKLDADLQADLVDSMELYAKHEANGRQHLNLEEGNPTLFKTRCQVIERTELGKRMNTHQLFQAAQALKYVELSSGSTVYKRGEEGIALYFILSGRVRISNGRERSPAAAKSLSPAAADDFWSIDICEGNAFGAESLVGGIVSSSRRLTTAVAVGMDNNTPVRLLYLLLDDYLAIYSPWQRCSRESNQMLKTGGFQLYKRSAIDCWKAAAFQITRDRRPWISILHQECRDRTELTFGMVHHLPLFKDVPKQQCLEVCKYCVVEVVSLDSIVFERGDAVLDQFFLVIEGSVTIQHLAPPSGDARATKIPIRVLNLGDSFGEVEMMLEVGKRLVDAVVSSTGTKLLCVPKEVFFKFWPQRSHLQSKLATLQHAFGAASPLDPEQLCAMYHCVKECSFKRNDVVFGGNTPRGTLVVIESGLCVVHDYITLQRKRPRKPVHRFPLDTKPWTPKLALDTPVACLGPGTILFADDEPISLNSPNSPEEQYTVADSPVVNAFSVQLYPRNSDTPTGGTISSRRNHELLMVVLLGRGGLLTVRAAISAQQSRRTESVNYSVRLATTASKDAQAPLLSSHASPLKRVIQNANGKLQSPPMQMELLHYLRDRSLPATYKPTEAKEPSNFVPVGPTMGESTIPTKPIGSSVGSFGAALLTTRAQGLFPILQQAGRSDHGPEVVQHEISAYVDPAVVAASMRSAQLIKETRIIAELSQQPRKLTHDLKLNDEKRQRHGRPPSRQLESRGRLIDILTPDTKFENERKRSGLCRRLLHVKGNEELK